MKAAISKFYRSIKMSSSPKQHSQTTPSQSTNTSPAIPPTTITTENNNNKMNEIERVFRHIDENGDGKISPSELHSSVLTLGGPRLSTEEVEAAVLSTDSDGDGFLDLGDFQRLMEAKDVSHEEKMAELKDAFAMFAVSTDGGRGKGVDGGVITAKSLKKMLSKLGDKKSVEECGEMIKGLDLNGDGVLCFDEFVAMMR